MDFVGLHDGGAGANDAGYSYTNLVSGADLVLTQLGAVPAASAGYRQLTQASSQYFTATQNSGLLEAIFGNADEKWAMILKFKDWSLGNYVFGFNHAGGVGTSFYLDNDAGGTLHIGDADTADETVSTATSIAISGPVYLLVQADGINKVRWGWQATKITTWAAIPAAQKAEVANVMGNFVGVAFSDANNGLYRYGATYVTMQVAYAVMNTAVIIE